MLAKLSIQNYALISQLAINFTGGLSIITGETGAGKSILLGALGLVLGNRVDLSALKDAKEKCIIEAEFAIDKYNLQEVFENLNLDYEKNTIIRRVILPSGKSRAFVNDTPVKLSDLNELKSRLMDIHSQHQTLQLSDENFQFSIIDALAKNQAKVASYKRGLEKLNKLKREITKLKQNQEEANKQYEYNLYLFKEIEEAKLQADEQQELEQNFEKLNNIEEIKQNLSEALQVSVNEEVGLQTSLNLLENKLNKINSYSKEYQALANRVSSIKIELDDIVFELEKANEYVDFNPNELEEINNRLQLIYNLQKKHQVNSVEELLSVYDQLSKKVASVENATELIAKKQAEIDEVASKLNSLAKTISKSREKAIPLLKSKLEKLLHELGMKNARFQISVKYTEQYFLNGKDELKLLFAANKGGNLGELKKVASGGELSRIMLSVKKILSENTQLPTIIFDEIDTGVSGEISNKMAEIMQEMGNDMQVITITHLPQIAAKGKYHYKVYKKEIGGITESNMKKLSEKERIMEIAEMLHGKDFSESAVNHAKELLN